MPINIQQLLAHLLPSCPNRDQAETTAVTCPKGTVVHQDLPYIKNGHPLQKLDIYIPKVGVRPLPLIIWYHPGRWQISDKTDCALAVDYLNYGYAIACVNYRLVPQSIFPSQVEDCKAAVRWLRAHAEQYELDVNRFASFGASCGGYQSSMVALTSHVQLFDAGDHLDQSSAVLCAVDYSGPTDFLQMDAHRLPDGRLHDVDESAESMFLGGPLQEIKETATMANPITYVNAASPPFLICHGDADLTVPDHQSQLLVAALAKAQVPVSYYVVPGADHYPFHGDPDPVAQELTKLFFATHLKPVL